MRGDPDQAADAILFESGFVRGTYVTEGYGHLDIVLNRVRIGEVAINQLPFKLAIYGGAVQLIIGNLQPRPHRVVVLWLTGPYQKFRRTARHIARFPDELRGAVCEFIRSLPEVVERVDWNRLKSSPIDRAEWRRIALQGAQGAPLPGA
ncbi:MAG TPA: hypothetical protein VFB36_01630 [Nevskiaceae bacterium]|nr:hypothetical protein [Nevskiaceae bacterium]